MQSPNVCYHLYACICCRLICSLRGAAVGDGPLRSMWSALIMHIVSQTGHWLPIANEMFSPLITSLPPSSEDLILFQTYGLIIWLTLLWTQDYLPLSPFLLLYLLKGFHACISPQFIRAMSKLFPVINFLVAKLSHRFPRRT
jgi:hypothetical protein